MPPFNPSANRITTAKGAGMPNQQGLNNPESYNGQGYNTFKRGGYHLTTTRFADVKPFFCEENISGDVVRFKTDFKLNTYTLQTPMLMPLEMHQDYFSVPWSAMLDNWELLYKVPLNTSDVPEDAYPFMHLSMPLYFIKTALDGQVSDYASTSSSGVVRLLYLVLMLWAIYSQDSLLASLGYGIPNQNVAYADVKDVDAFVEQFIERLLSMTPEFVFHSNSNETTGSTQNTWTPAPSDKYQLFNYLTKIISGDIVFDYFSSITVDEATEANPSGLLYSEVKAFVDGYYVILNSVAGSGDQPANSSVRPVDIKRLIAYQMCVAQYFGNPNVDVVTSAASWKKNMLSLYRSIVGVPDAFTVGGVNYYYDIFSFNSVKRLFQMFLYPLSTNSFLPYFVFNLFGVQHSLRGGDYFLSSRLRPLAVDNTGSTSIPVNSNNVAALDVNKGLLYQRFLNAINRTSGEIYEYMSNITGIKPERIAPQPNFIAHKVYNLGNQEIENTAGTNLQAGKTSLMVAERSDYIFEVFNDEPSVVIGLCSFQMPFVYARATDRQMLQRDRYDWFQNFLQDVGDQEVMTFERNANAPDSYVFGYQLRYAEFKNGLNRAVGGFAYGVLPSYAPIPSTGRTSMFSYRLSSGELRNRDDEFDKFYASLTSVAPAGRFHFILSFYNDVLVNSRQASYPKLL